MAEEKVEKDEGEPESPPKSGLKKWIILGSIVVFLLAGGYVGRTFFIKGSEKTEPANAAAGKEKPKAKEESRFGLMFPLDTFVVNLNDPGGKRYLKAKIELEYVQEEVKNELTARLPQLRDMVLLQLSSKTLDEIQGIDGKVALRNVLLTRINQVLKNGKIRNLYFTEFVIQ